MSTSISKVRVELRPDHRLPWVPLAHGEFPFSFSKAYVAQCASLKACIVSYSALCTLPAGAPTPRGKGGPGDSPQAPVSECTVNERTNVSFMPQDYGVTGSLRLFRTPPTSS